ncbi:MAG: DUF4177 domain-containing protein [Desulforhopalus sp.]
MRWSYKTVHYELKKEGLLGSAFLDESEIEQSLNEYGKAGWELISVLETLDGLIAVFKQPLSLQTGAFYPQEQMGDSQQTPKIRSRKVYDDVHQPPPHSEKKTVRNVSEEPLLLDDFEIFEETGTDNDRRNSRSAGSPVDAGTIRIE